MKYFLPFVCFLGLSRNVFGRKWIQHDDEIFYQDLMDLGASCYPFDSCWEHRMEDRVFPQSNYTCSCHSQCWELGTCCIDSPDRVKFPTQKCRKIDDSFYGYYMVNSCPYNICADSIWKIPCEKEWSGEDDILMLSPVTSLESSVTYKNYYCFRCHETTDNYISWNLNVYSTYKSFGEMRDYSVTYNQEKMTWVATVEKNHTSIPVNLTFQFPYYTHERRINPILCDLSMISDCPATWTDKRVHNKCLAYTAILYQGLTKYKNAHCALCNYVSLNETTCFQTVFAGFGGKEIFSFAHLLNINDSVGDKAGNAEKCDKDHLWDPYSKKCREKSCALPGYVIKDNRCVPP